MLSRRDLVHSRQFLDRRLHTALVAQRPDPLDWSGARLSGASLVAVMLLVISIAAVGIYGFIRPAGAKSWTSCDRVIVEKETGAAYVCDGERLYPVLNFASAALLRGLGQPPLTVGRASLTWPRGPLLGVPEAPDALPAANNLLTGAWSLCVRPVVPGGPARTVAVVGQPVAAGPPLVREAVAVTDTASNALYLIFQGRRHPIQDADIVAQALGIKAPDVLPVGAPWLATLPVGPPVAKIVIDGRGGPVAGRPEAKVGQIFVNGEGPAQQRFVARSTGLQPITALQEALIRATAKDVAPPVRIDQVQLAGGTTLPPLTEQQLGDGEVPPIVPVVRSRGAICQVIADASDTRRIWVGVLDIPSGAPVDAPRISPAGTLLADDVFVPPGRGALVMAVASPQATGGPVFLVTETGRRHAIGSSEALARLGYGGVGPVRLPSSLLERLPEGPVLSEMNVATPVP